MRERKVIKIGSGTSAAKVSDSVKTVKISGNVSISPETFCRNETIESVLIAGDVLKIGKKSFYGCLKLSEVDLQEGIQEIGDMAFEGCTSLCNVKIPTSVTFIGTRAFSSVGEDFELAVVPESYAHTYAIQNAVKFSFYNQPILTVTYYNAYGTELGKEQVLYGENCTKAEEFAAMINNFESWDNSTQYITQNIDLKPVLKTEENATILFYSGSEILYAQTAQIGEKIDYETAEEQLRLQGKDIIVEDTNLYRNEYTFIGWDKSQDRILIAETILINAEYSCDSRPKYKVDFVCLGQTVNTQYILHNEKADYALAETAMDNKNLRSVENVTEIHYFQGWDTAPGKITENTIVTANYESYYAETESVGKDVTATFLKDTLTINGQGATYDYTDSKPDFYAHKSEIKDIYINSSEIEFSDSLLDILFECCDTEHIHGNVIVKCGENMYSIVQNNDTLTVRGEGELASNAFDKLSNLAVNIKNIVIPKTVTSMGYGVLKNFANVEKLTLPYIGKSRDIAFVSTGDKEAVLGYLFEESDAPKDGFTEQAYIVDGYVVYSKIPQSIQEIEITDAKIIPFGAFQNTKNLRKFTVNESCERIYGKILKGCNKIEELVVPYIGRHYCYSEYAMSYDLSLGYWFDFERISTWYNEETDDWMNCREEIFNPSTEVSKSYRNFEEKWDIEIDDGEVTRHKTLYGYKACQYTTPNSLKKITITSDEMIPTGAFAYENNIEEVAATKTKAIGWFCFYNARKLKKVDMPNLEKVFAFGFCKARSLTKVPYESIKYIESFAFAFSGITEYVFREDCEFAKYHYIGSMRRKVGNCFVFAYTPIKRLVLTASAIKSADYISLCFCPDTISPNNKNVYTNKKLYQDEQDLYMPQLEDFEYRNVSSQDIIDFFSSGCTTGSVEYISNHGVNTVYTPADAVYDKSKHAAWTQSIPGFSAIQKVSSESGNMYYYYIKQFPGILFDIIIKATDEITIHQNVEYICPVKAHRNSEPYGTVNINCDNLSNITGKCPAWDLSDINLNITNFDETSDTHKRNLLLLNNCTDYHKLLVNGGVNIPISLLTEAVVENGVLKTYASDLYDNTSKMFKIPKGISTIDESVRFPMFSNVGIDVGEDTKVCNSFPRHPGQSDINFRGIEELCYKADSDDYYVMTADNQNIYIDKSVQFPKSLKKMGALQIYINKVSNTINVDFSQTQLVDMYMPNIYNLTNESPIENGVLTRLIFPNTVEKIRITNGSGTSISSTSYDDYFEIILDRKATFYQDKDWRKKETRIMKLASDRSSFGQKDYARTKFSEKSDIVIDATVISYSSMMMSYTIIPKLTFTEKVCAIDVDGFWSAEMPDIINFEDSQGNKGENKIVLLGYDVFQSLRFAADCFNGRNVKIFGAFAYDHTSTDEKSLVIHELTTNIGGSTAEREDGYFYRSAHRSTTIPQWLNYTTNGNYGDHQWYDYGRISFYKSIEVEPQNQDFKAVCDREDGVPGKQVLVTRDGKRLITMARGTSFKDKVLRLPEGIERMDSLSLGAKWTVGVQALQLPDSFIVSEFYTHVQENPEFNSLTEPLYFDTSIKEFMVKSTNTRYTCLDGMLFSRNRLDFWALPVSKYGECLTIPKGTTSIKHGAIMPYSTGAEIAPAYTSTRRLHFKGISIPASVSYIDNQTTYAATNGTYLRNSPGINSTTQLVILNRFADKTSVKNTVTGATVPFSFTLDSKNRWYKLVNGKIIRITSASEIAANNFKFAETDASGEITYSDGIAYNDESTVYNGFARAFLMALNFLHIYDYDDIYAAINAGKWDLLCKKFLNKYCPSGYDITAENFEIDDYDMHNEFVSHRNDLAGLKTAADNFKSTNLNPVILKIVTSGDNGPSFHYFLPTSVTVNSSGKYEITAYGGIDYDSNLNISHSTNTDIAFDRPFKLVWDKDLKSREIYCHYRNGLYEDSDAADDVFPDTAEYEDVTQYKVQDFMRCAVGDIMWCDMEKLMRHKFSDKIDFLSKMWETLEQ